MASKLNRYASGWTKNWAQKARNTPSRICKRMLVIHLTFELSREIPFRAFRPMCVDCGPCHTYASIHSLRAIVTPAMLDFCPATIHSMVRRDKIAWMAYFSFHKASDTHTHTHTNHKNGSNQRQPVQNFQSIKVFWKSILWHRLSCAGRFGAKLAWDSYSRSPMLPPMYFSIMLQNSVCASQQQLRALLLFRHVPGRNKKKLDS